METFPVLLFCYEVNPLVTGKSNKLIQTGSVDAYLGSIPQRAFEFIQYIPRNMHTVFALLCFVVVIHWLIFPYPSGLHHWHCGNLTIATVPAKQPWWIWINTSCEFIMNDCITTKKHTTTKPCAYFLGYTVTESCKNIVAVLSCGWSNLFTNCTLHDSSLLVTCAKLWHD